MYKMRLRKHIFNYNNLIALVALVIFFLAATLNSFNEKPEIVLSKQETALNLNNDLLILMSAGNKRLITDLLWIQTLIESDLEHYKVKDLNNWLFLRFNTIAKLDPNFYENYLYGGQFLAVIKDDLIGANDIYEKSIKYFPYDFSLNFNAGIMNYFEADDPEKGIFYLSRIIDNPKTPTYIQSIINKLKIEAGFEIEDIFEMVKLNLETTQDEVLKARLEKDLFNIKVEIDIKCLNSKTQTTHCDRKDFYGRYYPYQNGKYVEPVEFQPYRIKRREP